MSGNLHPVRSKDQLLSKFDPPVPKITQEINLRELIHIWWHLKNCVQATETDFVEQVYLYIVCSAILWCYFFIRPCQILQGGPGTNPSYANNEGWAVNTNMCDVWQLKFKY